MNDYTVKSEFGKIYLEGQLQIVKEIDEIDKIWNPWIKSIIW